MLALVQGGLDCSMLDASTYDLAERTNERSASTHAPLISYSRVDIITDQESATWPSSSGAGGRQNTN